jgi:putative phosphoribosyl transferase
MTDEVPIFADRRDAGRRLARRLAAYADEKPVVVALPRGGVPVAAEVAAGLKAPLDILVVRKIGVPWQPELGLGAIAEGDVRVLNRALVAEVGMTATELEAVLAQEGTELQRRVHTYRRDRPPVSVEGRVVIVVDDGLATGYTARAAIESVRRRGARAVVLAVPVAPADSVRELGQVADRVVALEQPPWFFAIGAWYRDFGQTSDEEVITLLEEADARRGAASAGGPTRPGREAEPAHSGPCGPRSGRSR